MPVIAWLFEVPLGSLAAGESKSASIYYAAPLLQMLQQSLSCWKGEAQKECQTKAADEGRLSELLHEAESAHDQGPSLGQRFVSCCFAAPFLHVLASRHRHHYIYHHIHHHNRSDACPVVAAVPRCADLLHLRVARFCGQRG